MTAARFEDIIAALEDARIRYVVAGGFAVNLHGFNRFTKEGLGGRRQNLRDIMELRHILRLNGREGS